VAEYTDTISGSKEGPGRRKLLEDAHRGMFDLVLCWRFDRFARSAKDLLLALDTLTSLGVGFSSVREAFDTTTPVGRATVTILAAVAELEKSIIRERVQAGLDRARRKGIKLGRPERDVDVARALEMMTEGKTQRQVAMALRVPRSTLRRALDRADG
jgi:DNA invertase Pin-like site-specific DNA recombinase